MLRRPAAPDRVRITGRTLHTASDRVLVVELDPEADVARLHRDPAVRWIGNRPPSDVVDELDPAERLFVGGWVRREAGNRERRGDGLDWDTPGFLPPDPPPGSGTPSGGSG